MLNEIDPTVLARSANKLTRYLKTTTGDKDIIRRRWLPLDFDPVRPTGISSTDDEHAATLDTARACASWLRSLGWPCGIVADSGNGAHLLYAIDLPNDQPSATLVRHAITAVAQRFTGDAVKVDTAVFNAARIWKLYGTVARKGDSVPDRPHRVAQLIDVPEHLQVVTAEQLQALAAATTTPAAPLPSANGNGHCEHKLDVARWLTDRCRTLRVKDSPLSDGRAVFLLDQCPFDSSHGGHAEVAIFQSPDGKLGVKNVSTTLVKAVGGSSSRRPSALPTQATGTHRIQRKAPTSTWDHCWSAC